MLTEFCQNLVDDEVFSTFKARLKIPNITININFNAHALSNSCLDMFSVLSHEYKFSCLFRIARWKQKLLVVMMKGNKLWTQNYLKYVIFVNILCFFVFANTGAFTIIICFFHFHNWNSDSRGYKIWLPKVQLQTGWSQWLLGNLKRFFKIKILYFFKKVLVMPPIKNFKIVE